MHNWHCHSLAKLTSPTNVTVVLHCVRLACGRAIPEYVVPRINVCVSQMREFMRFIKCTQGQAGCRFFFIFHFFSNRFNDG